MEFNVINGVFTLNLNIVGTLALACLLITLGSLIKRRVSILDKFCIPGPVIGGLVFAVLVYVLMTLDIMNIVLDTTLQSIFMVAFFTTVGLDASLSVIRKGGKSLFVYWVFCIILIFSQNIIGVLGASLTGIDPLLGLMCGAISMGGGHGTSAAFGPTIEALGIEGAMTIGIAAATLGLISGSLSGAPTARYLIKKHNLSPISSNDYKNIDTVPESEGMHSEIIDSDSSVSTSSVVDTNSFIKHLLIVTVCMSLGYIVSDIIVGLTGFTLPEYVGGIVVAMIFRNTNDKFKLVKVDYTYVELLGNVSLRIFLTMALMSIKLWELKTLGIPMVIIVISQVLFLVLFTVFIMFRILGKDYDAAVMISGFMGHQLGATPNALANMNSICNKYGYSQKAFFIIPIVCAFMIDLVALPTISMFINFLK